jgi:hypothetical protein
VAFPHRRPRHAPSLPTPLTYVPVTYAARALVVRPLPTAVGHAADPAMATRAHVPWRLRSFPAEPRASISVAGAGDARRRIPPRRPKIDWPRASPPLCCKYISQMFADVCCNLLHVNVVKVDLDVVHVTYFCSVFQWYVASVLKKCFICFRRMF